MGPPRRSTRKRNKPAKKYEDFAEIELDDLKEGVQLDFKDIPTLSPSVRTFKAQSTKQKREGTPIQSSNYVPPKNLMWQAGL